MTMFVKRYVSGGKSAHGEVDVQCKRKTILNVGTAFPCVKKRQLVTSRKEVKLTIDYCHLPVIRSTSHIHA
jgi:hypothetical protein